MRSGRVAEPEGFYEAVRRTVRKAAGRALTPALKRWRNTRIGDDWRPELRPEVIRFLVRFGMLDAGEDPEVQRAAFQRQLDEIARKTGEAPGVAAAWLEVFAAGAYGLLPEGICGEHPACSRCELNGNCRFLLAGGRSERLWGAELARRLGVAEGAKASTPAASELLSFLFSRGEGGAGEVARTEAMLNALGGVRKLLAAPAERLREVGLDAAGVAVVRAMENLCRLWGHEQEVRGKLFARGEDFFEHFHLRLRDSRKECFHVVCLDQKNRYLGEEQVSEGSLTETLVHPREVFAPAIRLRAAAVAVIHNHPSGDPRPSPQDKALTKRLEKAADLVGIRLLDHVIVGDGRYASFVDEGLL